MNVLATCTTKPELVWPEAQRIDTQIVHELDTGFRDVYMREWSKKIMGPPD